MTLSAGPATDHLVTCATTAVNGLTAQGKPFLVFDGWPTAMAAGMFVIGLDSPWGADTPPSGDTRGTRSWVALGVKAVAEDYTIPSYIDVRSAGKGVTQKTVRDLAHQAFDDFWTQVKADTTLGGALQPGPAFVEIADFASTPSSVGDAAEQGHRQLVTFGVHIRNRTT